MRLGGRGPAVVAVLNVTPDSFSDGGKWEGEAVAAGQRFWDEGAEVVEVGGESTRPGASEVSEAEELRRVLPVVEALARSARGTVAIDTRKAAVAAAAVRAGATMVNDVSGLRHDPKLALVVAETGAALVVMHSRGTPETMNRLARYDDVAGEVMAELGQAVSVAEAAGVRPENIILDPGLGFAKDTEHNLILLQQWDRLRAMPYPWMVGPSRKRFLGVITGRENATDRDPATAAVCTYLAWQGVEAVRVHAVAMAVDAVKVGAALSGVSA